MGVTGVLGVVHSENVVTITLLQLSKQFSRDTLSTAIAVVSLWKSDIADNWQLCVRHGSFCRRHESPIAFSCKTPSILALHFSVESAQNKSKRTIESYDHKFSHILRTIF